VWQSYQRLRSTDNWTHCRHKKGEYRLQSCRVHFHCNYKIIPYTSNYLSPIPYYIILHHTTSYYIILHHTTSYYITLHHTTSQHLSNLRHYPGTCLEGHPQNKKSPIFWDTTPCSPLKIGRRFEGSKKPPAIACYVLSLFLDNEIGGEVFRRNVSLLSTDYTTL
jgi:hypothetical protein